MKEKTLKHQAAGESAGAAPEELVRVTIKDQYLPSSVADQIRERGQRLKRYYPRLQLCLVTVEGPGAHHRSGGPYRVQIEMRVPKHEPLMVNRHQEEDLSHAIKESFEAAKRRLIHFAEVQRGEVRGRNEKLADLETR